MKRSLPSSSSSSSSRGKVVRKARNDRIEQKHDDDNDKARPSHRVFVGPFKLPKIESLPTLLTLSTEASTEESSDDLSVVRARTGLVYHVGEQHVDPHGRQRERPNRITGVWQALQSNLLSQCCVSGSSNCSNHAADAAAAFLKDEDYLRVHLPGYMQRINKFATCTCHQLDDEARQYQSVFLTQQSTLEAKQAAGKLCTLVSDVVQGKLDNGFAVIRPPGHHAEPGVAGGYCIINNIAVAAAYARTQLGVGKIMIVDWDIHHGNGTQKIFWHDPNVLYFSVHRGGNFYPFSPAGRASMVGQGEGLGYNINVSWTTKGMGDDEYCAVWQTLLMPVLREYEPDLILVSAGFDGADGDMGECHVTPSGFGRLASSLVATGVPVVCALEGGYVPSVLQACVKSVVRALLDAEPSSGSSPAFLPKHDEEKDAIILENIHPVAAKCIRATHKAHASYWKCLQGSTP